MQTPFGKWFDSLSGDNIYRFYSAIFATVALCSAALSGIYIYWIFTRISDKPQPLVQYVAAALILCWALFAAASALHKRYQIEKSEEIQLSHLPYAMLFSRMSGEILALLFLLKGFLNLFLSAFQPQATGWIGEGNQFYGFLYILAAICCIVFFHTLADAIDYWIYSSERKTESPAPEISYDQSPSKNVQKETKEIISPELQMLLDLKNSGAVNDAEFKLLLKELRSK